MKRLALWLQIEMMDYVINNAHITINHREMIEFNFYLTPYILYSIKLKI